MLTIQQFNSILSSVVVMMKIVVKSNMVGKHFRTKGVGLTLQNVVENVF